jgi:transcriptional regulator of acetoin/glycerol metabolism
MTRAAALLGLSRNTLYRKLKRHGIEAGAWRHHPH